ncbi:MAG: SRPBCC family protein [Pseudomonadota bacterium]
MKFSAREDIAAPIDQVFVALCDFEGFERQAMRRGAQVQRVDAMVNPGVGMKWQANFQLRGRARDVTIELVRFDTPNELVFDAKSSGIDAVMQIELLALSRNRTRMAIGFEMTPLNLSARLLIQSLKLAKNNLTKRFKLRVADYSKGLEERLQRST